MKEDKQYSSPVSRTFHENRADNNTSGSKDVYFIKDNRSSFMLQAELADAIQQKENKTSQLRVKRTPENILPLHFPNIIQRKIYYQSTEINDKDNLLKTIFLEVAKYVDKGIISDLVDQIWSVYRGKKSIRVEKILEILEIKYILNGKKIITDLVGILDSLKNPSSTEIFIRRISQDSRLAPEDQDRYIDAFLERSTKPEAYLEAKERFRFTRYLDIHNRISSADTELRKGNYYKDTYKGKGSSAPGQRGKPSRSLDLDFRTIKIDSDDVRPLIIDPDDVQPLVYPTIIEDIRKRVLGMRENLMASWYYNSANEQIILKSGVLLSSGARGGFFGKTMMSDLLNVTQNYFYSFIEHADSPFNTGTRFANPSQDEGNVGERGVPDDSGRRLRVSLRKLIKSGAMAMGGDLKDDRQEKKWGLAQNATPHKFFASGDTPDQLFGLLQNYVNFIGNRILLFLKHKKISQKTKDEKMAELQGWLGKKDHELWEYLIRNVAQPQLMTPERVSLGIKGMTIDDRNGFFYTP